MTPATSRRPVWISERQMAIHISILLIEQTSDRATYEYSQPVYAPDPARAGRFRQSGLNVGRAEIAKATGEVRRLTETPWDAADQVFIRVAAKLREAQRDGRFPATLSYSA